jgi:Tfp pilus assembly PilM family ATPase
MMRIRMLPLGIDLGSTRIRVASMERHRNGEVRLRAVVARDLPEGAVAASTIEHPELVTALLEEMRAEIGGKERRCILALGMPLAVLRMVQLPRMTRGERIRAARFEAARFVPWNLDEERSLVRAHRVGETSQIWAIGAARAGAAESRVGAARSAGLRVVGIDHDSLAFERALGRNRIVVDVGSSRSTVHAPHRAGGICRMIACGGEEITKGIARDLSIDLVSAERRKRILGVAGAGAAAHSEFVNQLAETIGDMRLEGASIALTGNGVRLPGLAAALESATGALVDIPVPSSMTGDAYPDDVLRAASPDWTLAVGLALRGHAA